MDETCQQLIATDSHPQLKKDLVGGIKFQPI